MKTQQLTKLLNWFDGKNSVLVALSGGVDSALVAYFAYAKLGKSAIAVTADYKTLAKEELYLFWKEVTIYWHYRKVLKNTCWVYRKIKLTVCCINFHFSFFTKNRCKYFYFTKVFIFIITMSFKFIKHRNRNTVFNS